MCNYKSFAEKRIDKLAEYYSADYDKVLEEVYGPRYVENAFDHFATPILTTENPRKLIAHNWGMIPWFTRNVADGLAVRIKTVTVLRKCLRHLRSVMQQRMVSAVSSQPQVFSKANGWT